MDLEWWCRARAKKDMKEGWWRYQNWSVLNWWFRADWIVDYDGEKCFYFTVYDIDSEIRYVNKEDLESEDRNPYQSEVAPGKWVALFITSTVWLIRMSNTNFLVIKVIGRHPINKESVCLWVHNWFPHIEVKYTATYNFENVEAAYRMIQNDLDLFKVSLPAHA